MGDGTGGVSEGTLLGVFARYWQPGEVKTRLAQHIGNESAAFLHRQFVETTLRRLDVARDQWLVVTPAETIGRIAAQCAAARNWQLVAQTEGDLGQRMQDFFRSAFNTSERIVLVGSDSPDLPLQVIEQAFAELARTPVVMGPAADGGYYLIGLAARLLTGTDLSFLFDAMPWSCSDLLSVTLRKLTDRGIECRLLPRWHDVDDWEGLLELWRRLAAEPLAAEPALADLRSAVEQVMAANLPE